MFSTFRTLARTILLAALVGGSALAVPSAASAQSANPERALLNWLQAPSGDAGAGFTHVQAAPAPAEQALLDGERALMNPYRAVAPRADESETGHPVVSGVRAVDGVRALLNGSSS